MCSASAPLSIPGCCVGFFHCLILILNEGTSCQEAGKNRRFTFYCTKAHLLSHSSPPSAMNWPPGWPSDIHSEKEALQTSERELRSHWFLFINSVLITWSGGTDGSAGQTLQAGGGPMEIKKACLGKRTGLIVSSCQVLSSRCFEGEFESVPSEPSGFWPFTVPPQLCAVPNGPAPKEQ